MPTDSGVARGRGSAAWAACGWTAMINPMIASVAKRIIIAQLSLFFDFARRQVSGFGSKVVLSAAHISVTYRDHPVSAFGVAPYDQQSSPHARSSKIGR